MKDDPKNEDKILAEIRRRVLDLESKNQENDDLENLRRANIQALDEMSSLNEQQIMRIASQVRKEYELKEAKAKRTRVLVGGIGAVLLLIAIIFYIGHRQDMAAREAYLANKFIETFDDNKNGWSIFNDTKYSKKIANGNYTIEIGDGACYWDKATLPLPAYYAVELSSTWQRGEQRSEYGLALVQENGDVLAFSLDASGTTNYGHYKNEKWEKTTDWAKGVARPEREENRQRIEVKDNRSFKYFLNGTLVLADTFSRTVPTQVALRSCGKQIVDFHSIKVINLANNRVIFEDDFNNPNATKWSPESEVGKTSSIENGKYFFEMNTKDYCEWATQPYKIEAEHNVDIVLKTNHLKGESDNFGIIISQDNTNYYTFDFKNDGKARRNFYEIDKWTHIGEYVETNIFADENKPPATLRIEIRERFCKYFVNDRLIDKFEIAPYFSIAHIGMRCCGKQKVAFDELQIIPK